MDSFLRLINNFIQRIYSEFIQSYRINKVHVNLLTTDIPII